MVSLRGLDNSYASVKSSINIRLEKVALNELTVLLLHEEQRIEADAKALASPVSTTTGTPAAPPPKANVVTAPPNNSSDDQPLRGRGGRGGRGRNCWRSSHGSANYPQQQQHGAYGALPQQQQQHVPSSFYQHGQPSSRPMYQTCNKVGHLAHNYWNRHDAQQFPPTVTKSAYMASSPSQFPDPNSWYIDSGASHHVTDNMRDLSIKSEYCGNDHLALGDGKTILITHTGSSSLSAINIRLEKVTLNELTILLLHEEQQIEVDAKALASTTTGTLVAPPPNANAIIASPNNSSDDQPSHGRGGRGGRGRNHWRSSHGSTNYPQQ
ncbi:hypothetical protein V2J09_013088 [Rumex salicifolius]